MSLINISILTMLLSMGFRGLLRGLFKETASLAAILLGGWLAFRFHSDAAIMFYGIMPLAVARIVAFITLLILVGLVSHAVGNLLTNLVKLALLGWVNRIGGLVLGCVEACLVLGMFFYTVINIPFPFRFKEEVTRHSVAMSLSYIGGTALDNAKHLKKQTQ